MRKLLFVESDLTTPFRKVVFCYDGADGLWEDNDEFHNLWRMWEVDIFMTCNTRSAFVSPSYYIEFTLLTKPLAVVIRGRTRPLIYCGGGQSMEITPSNFSMI